MTNDSDVDSWKTESDSIEFGKQHCPNRKKITIIDVYSGGIYDNANYYYALVKSSKSAPKIRYINPAIYTESTNEKEHKAMEIRSESNCQREECYIERTIDANPKLLTIDLPAVHSTPRSVTNVDCAGEHPVTGQKTYRCYSTSLPDTTLCLEPFTARSMVSSGTITRVERQCKLGSALEDVGHNEAVKREKCILDNRQNVRISTTSLSLNPGIANYQISNGAEFARKTAHAEWIRRKDEAAQRKREDEERAAKKRREEEERIARQKEEKARLEKENFLKWTERKRQQELNRKAMLENELELQKRLKEIEDKVAVAKALYHRQWIHKKKEEQKARHKEQEMRQKRMNEEREKRLEQSSKAYEKWKENSRNRPKPATQGLLPHQKAKPTYVNPIPWRSIVEIDSDEAQENAFNDKKGNTNQLKMNRGKTIVAYQ